jgi:hypothetical protein
MLSAAAVRRRGLMTIPLHPTAPGVTGAAALPYLTLARRGAPVSAHCDYFLGRARSLTNVDDDRRSGGLGATRDASGTERARRERLI